MFKVNWEKTSAPYALSADIIEKMVRLAYPDQNLVSHTLIADGCANLNYKIQLEREKHPLILRIYVRNKDAAHIEQKLAVLIKETVPAPLTHYRGDVEGYSFAITEFMPGMTLRDLLLGNAPYDLSAIMHEVGTILSKITKYEFPSAGFFNRELDVIPCESFDIIKFSQGCLRHDTILSVLPPAMISNIHKTMEQHAHLFPDKNERHLVHGDFDPANILVDQMNGSWVVTGILDFEFAFSGSYLWDIANMLRYAHKMPPEFHTAFLHGFRDGGVALPENWRTTTHLFNLVSLLDCLQRSDPKNQPNRCADMCELIDHNVSALNKF